MCTPPLMFVCIWKKRGGKKKQWLHRAERLHPPNSWFLLILLTTLLHRTHCISWVGAEYLMQILMTDTYQVKQTCIHKEGRRQQCSAQLRRPEQNQNTELIKGKIMGREEHHSHKVLAADECKQLCLMDNRGITPHLRIFSGTKKQDNKVLQHFRRANS